MDKVLQSVSIRSIRYDSVKQELDIHFLNRGTYRYQKVPLAVYEGLLLAELPDNYIEKQIKPNYQAVKMLTV
ncbi:KTSC domain-containing protein [Anaerospora hongkongensis]|uniref:KTSC domain-containing protein n=1 Tax=Anaerospora hongkongensis TaxID=244830 RepID=A0A4V6NG63_9FIRM|nr:KTSC domain-containing protein [Anaerospora hongkongensis]TCL31987.1 KTSC domain-containing protein [Anaerospora hongkongensis]